MAKALERELKRPDEFVSFWTHVGAWLSKHLKPVLVGVVCAIVILVAGFALSHFLGKKTEATTVTFARITKVASAELLPKEETKATPAAAPQGIPRFKTEEERLQQVIREADAFVAAKGSAGLGKFALFSKAGRLVLAGKAGEALPIYQQLLAGETDLEMRLVFQEAIASATEAAGNHAEALRLYTALTDESAKVGNFLFDQVAFSKALLLEKQGKPQDAVKVLREILEKAPKTTLRREIDDRLAILDEK